MNREEHLLTILSEECSEVSKEVCKALRFGLNDYRPGSSQTETNRKKITDELNDLIAVATMLKDEGYIDDFMDVEKMSVKMHKVEHYMQYSKNAGKLETLEELSDEKKEIFKKFINTISDSKEIDPEIRQIVIEYKKLLL